MNYPAILDALREFTARDRVDFLPTDAGPLSPYPPIEKYVRDFKIGAKPETAAEELFTSLCQDVLGLHPTRQVGLTHGYVDFMLPEGKGDPMPLELKPLFQREGPDALRRSDADPAHHVNQVKKYLHDHEYLILTDLRTAWFFSARDFFFGEKPFAQLPFADFLKQGKETGSLLDVLRRLEDTTEKPELEQQFFEDLKLWFDEFNRVKWTPPELAAESIILLINKLIFARTLEDFGLVKYHFVYDMYKRYVELWEPKGPHRIIPKFLTEFEEFFDEYYDTEIFSDAILRRLQQDPANLELFYRKLNFVLGVDQADRRGIVHYNYRRIDEDIFGKSHEMFLALNRKDEGIYYTPADITKPMADAMVESLTEKLVDDICESVGSQKCDFTRAAKLIAKLAEIRVADTACGSGGFLIKVLRAFWQQYQRIDDESAWVKNLTINNIRNPGQGGLNLEEIPPNVRAALDFRSLHHFDNHRILIARVLLMHIFGVDKDPGALEVAKTNIWKEAIKLSPADYNYRRLDKKAVKILPNLELNFHSADSLVDVELEKQAEWLAEYQQAELKKLSDLRARYIENPMNHDSLVEALQLRRKLRAGLIEHFQSESLPCEPAGFALHFWPCWFTAEGKLRKTPGFDGIIGNPPWEGFKPFRKEFAFKFNRGKPEFSKMGMDGPTFDKWFDAELKNNIEFATRWHQYEAGYEQYSEFFGHRFKYQGGGDYNLSKLFIEGDLALIRDGGRLSLLVPSGLQTDEGCGPLRKLLLTEHRFDELTSFENRGYKEIQEGKEQRLQIFPDVDSRYKFGFFKLVKSEMPSSTHTFDARFYLHDPKDVFAPPIRYSLEMIRRFSPENFSIMEFRAEADYLLCGKICGENLHLMELGFQFGSELHLTNDAHFFRKPNARKPVSGEITLYEGKMIHQFDARFSSANWCVLETEAREPLLRKEIYRANQYIRENDVPKVGGKKVPEKRDELEILLQTLFKEGKFKLHHEFERLGVRDVGRSTDERTLIAAIVPAHVCIGNTINFLRPFRYAVDSKGNLQQQVIDAEEVRSLLCLLDSFVLNYYIRNKVSAHVNIHQLNELPFPRLNVAQKKKLADFAGKLLKDPHDVKTRAALEVYVARELYGLTLEDWKHLTGTFTFGGGASKAELEEIIRQSLELWR